MNPAASRRGVRDEYQPTLFLSGYGPVFVRVDPENVRLNPVSVRIPRAFSHGHATQSDRQCLQYYK